MPRAPARRTLVEFPEVMTAGMPCARAMKAACETSWRYRSPSALANSLAPHPAEVALRAVPFLRGGEEPRTDH